MSVRAWAYALGAGGEPAVAKMLGTLRAELAVAMILTGCTNVRDAGRELLDLDLVANKRVSDRHSFPSKLVSGVTPVARFAHVMKP